MQKFYKVISFCIVLLSGLSFTTRAQLVQVGHVVISQVYGGGGNANAAYLNDYVELFNPTTASITMNNWSIQYASSGGITVGTASNATFSGTIGAGKYFLIKLVSGGSVGAPLTNPDASPTTNVPNMSQTSGKVFLANTTALMTLSASGCPTGSNLVDYVGYGAPNCSEGNSPAPSPGSTTSIFRASAGCQDTDVNGADFSAATASPRNSATTANICFPTYRSKTGGDFSNSTTWEHFNGTTYDPATEAPVTGTNVTILSGHNINQDVDYTVATGKTFTLTATSIYNINAGKSLTIAGTADFAGQAVNLKSDYANGTARIGAITGTLTNASNVTIERYIPGGTRQYRYLSHPFNTLTLVSLKDDIYISGPNNAAGFDPNSNGGASAFYFSAANVTSNTQAGQQAAWQPFTDINGTWAPRTGIAVVIRGDRTLQTIDATPPTAVTLDMTGTINQQDQTATLTLATINSGQPSQFNSDFNLVGNPYPSQIDLDKTTRTNVGSSFYVWNPTGASGAGNYSTNTFDAAASYILPSCAAFFVQATANGGTIVFHETDKTSGNPTESTLFRTNTSADQLRLQLETGGVIWDNLQFNFGDSYTTSKEYMDATKMMNPTVNLYSLSSDNRELAIDFRPLTQNSVIALGFIPVTQRSYTFRVQQLSLPINLTAYIKDKFNGNNLSPLVNGGTFNFNVTADAASAAIDRFEIVFAAASPLPVTFSNIKAFTKNSGVQIEWTMATENNMDKYVVERSSNGAQFTSIGTVVSRGNSLATVSYNLFDAAPLAVNYYRIKMTDKNGQVNYSSIVRINMVATKPGISVYPNPVVNDILSIQLDNLPKGNYSFILTNKSGQVMERKVIEHLAGSSTETLQLSDNLPAGVYQLSIIGDTFRSTQQITNNK